MRGVLVIGLMLIAGAGCAIDKKAASSCLTCKDLRVAHDFYLKDSTLRSLERLDWLGARIPPNRVIEEVYQGISGTDSIELEFEFK